MEFGARGSGVGNAATKTAEQMDRELDEMIEKMTAKGYNLEEDFTEEKVDHLLNHHPAFMRQQPTQEIIDESPLLQGLQKLRYEDETDTPEAKALAYKEDGNWHFKQKLYKRAIRAYTEGLNKKGTDAILNSTLYANRAASHFHLQNFGSSLRDSLQALKLDKNRTKSILRCAQCCEALEKYQDAMNWCRTLLTVDSDNASAKEIISRSLKSLQKAKRDARKRERQAELRRKRMQALVDCIRRRGITLDLIDINEHKEGEDFLSVEDSLVLSSVDNNNPSDAKVHFEDDTVEDLVRDGKLVWPSLFTYPEHRVSELVEEFHEDATFDDHLDVMFDDPAPWDERGQYKRPEIEIYHETDGGKGICKVHTDHTLSQVLSGGKITIAAGTPVFIVLSRLSPFKDTFLSKFSLVSRD